MLWIERLCYNPADMKFLRWLLFIAIVGGISYWYFSGNTPPVEIPDNIRTVVEDAGEFLTETTEEVQKTVKAPPPLRRAITGSFGEDLTIDGVLEWTNANRGENGFAPLTLNTELNAAAKAKVDDMFARQYFEHVSPDGRGPADLAETAGYEYVTVGENLALGNYEDDQDLVQAWMDSPGHRANILTDDFTEIGIAVGKGTFEGETTWLAVQSFGRPLSDCPQPDEALNAKITGDKSRLTAMENEAKSRKAVIESTPQPKTQSEVDAYNANVNAYNELIGTINELIKSIQGQITVYNGQVQAFNACAGN